MIVYVYPADRFGCGHYRLIWPGLALKAAGHDVRVIPPGAREGIEADVDQYHRVHTIRVPADADAIVMQRPTHSYLAQGIALLAETRPHLATIVDMDDDLSSIDPANPAFWAMHRRHGHELHNSANVQIACRHASLVTVSTPALLRIYAPHGRGIVLPNRVPAGFLDVPHTDSPVMSWPGSVHSHPNDLQQVGPAVARLVREGHRYVATGHPQGVSEALGLAGVTLQATGDVPHERWPWAVAGIGVGLAPLAATAFNRSKSWLKPLEMSATGVPWVASPRAEYLRLHREHQVGFMAGDPRAWYRRLRELLTSEALRVEQSQAGRAAGAANTVEGHAWRWWEAWSGAVKTRRATLPALRGLG